MQCLELAFVSMTLGTRIWTSHDQLDRFLLHINQREVSTWFRKQEALSGCKKARCSYFEQRQCLSRASESYRWYLELPVSLETDMTWMTWRLCSIALQPEIYLTRIWAGGSKSWSIPDSRLKCCRRNSCNGLACFLFLEAIAQLEWRWSRRSL